MIFSICPVYYAIYLGPVRDITTNTTFISLVYRPNGIRIENISFAINFAAQLTSFVLVIVCTVVLVQSLLRKYKWHKYSVSTNAITNRDKRLIKMIISLSIIFIICFLPSAVNLVVMMLTPGYSIVGKQANMFQVGWSFLNTLEATNSSVSIIVYYKMSSRFRQVLRRMFRVKSAKRRDCQGGPSSIQVSSA
ncbi:hypothetical protein BsWGS_26953 [Bradybaena similaris]